MFVRHARAHRAVLHAFPLLLAASLLSGCGIFSPDESSDGGGGGTPTEFKTPLTPDLMIENFEKSYEGLNILEYEKVLHPSFVFYFSAADLDADPDGSWDRASDIESATNMFSGELGSRIVNGEPTVVPAILSIDIVLTKREQWRQDFDDGAEFAEADFRGVYEVDMTVRYTDNELISRVQGLQRFYAERVDAVIDGQNQQIYQLYAWRDLGNPNI